MGSAGRQTIEPPVAAALTVPMQTMVLGNVKISRLVEWSGPFAPVGVLFPSMPEDLWQQNRSWLEPDFWEGDSGIYQAYMQSWLLQTPDRTVVVDTGIGNHKQRDEAVFHDRDGDFLEQLAVLGVRPEDVDTVVNTHLHIDHIGWNTVLDDDEWVPTFPNAQYLMSKVDYDQWNPANGHPRRSTIGTDADFHAGFHDSVEPVHRAGQAVLWEGESHRIDAELSLELAPGHTPGSAVLRMESGTDRALFVGDLIHTPLQFLEPDHDTCLSEDQPQAARSRRRMLAQAAETNSLIIPAHLAGAGAAEVRGEDGRYSIAKWATYTS